LILRDVTGAYIRSGRRTLKIESFAIYSSAHVNADMVVNSVIGRLNPNVLGVAMDSIALVSVSHTAAVRTGRAYTRR
jgi:hypothetical protein